jgi:hypothetical protein
MLDMWVVLLLGGYEYSVAAAVLVFRRSFGGLGLVVVSDLLSVVVVKDLVLFLWWL